MFFNVVFHVSVHAQALFQFVREVIHARSRREAKNRRVKIESTANEVTEWISLDVIDAGSIIEVIGTSMLRALALLDKPRSVFEQGRGVLC